MTLCPRLSTFGFNLCSGRFRLLLFSGSHPKNPATLVFTTRHGFSQTEGHLSPYKDHNMGAKEKQQLFSGTRSGYRFRAIDVPSCYI
jgi:hypothetical protein